MNTQTKRQPGVYECLWELSDGSQEAAFHYWDGKAWHDGFLDDRDARATSPLGWTDKLISAEFIRA